MRCLGGSVPSAARTAVRRSAARAISSSSTWAANSGVRTSSARGDDALAALQDAQALAAGGGADPGAEAVGVAQPADVLDGAQPRELGDVVGVGVGQPVRAADAADEHGVAVDQLAPGLRLSLGGGADERGGVALPATGRTDIGQGRDGLMARDHRPRRVGAALGRPWGVYHRA